MCKWRYEDFMFAAVVSANTRSEARAAVKRHFRWRALPMHFTLARLGDE